jgi:hypothetical protein
MCFQEPILKELRSRVSPMILKKLPSIPIPPQSARFRGMARIGLSIPASLRIAFFLASLSFRLPAADMFPFVLPWDDATTSATNVSAWLEKPAGRSGFIIAKDGHLFAGAKRQRFIGVNLAFGANFPTHDDAEKVAARMAKFGINCVRFHHMDMQSAPKGIFSKDGRALDAERLDRLDYFIAQLKAHGIYADLNLHVSRTYPDLPASEKEGLPNLDKGVDQFAAAMIALQKDYARALLTHINPYTKSAYTGEPAVAFIEINNENSLLDEWQIGRLDHMPAPYRAELSGMWTAWLKAAYGGMESSPAAWAVGARPAGPEMLQNGDFSHEFEHWIPEQHEGAAATMKVSDGVLRIDVQKTGAQPWHVQFNQAGLHFQEGDRYTVAFRARAATPRKLSFNASQANKPWAVLGSQQFTLTPEWRSYSFTFAASRSDDHARLSFTGFAAATGLCEFADLSLRIGAADGAVEREAGGAFVPIPHDEIANHTAAIQRDWYRFLWSTEERYWTGMKRFLREDLHAQSLIVGTPVGWSPFPIQEQMDVIDSHAYWQHPQFPRRPWDAEDWTVAPLPMTGAADGGVLPRLALQRVSGMPYICTEYNHAAPNPYSAETFPLICAYAAFQDWDAIFAFAYSHRLDDWATGYFPSFFDIDQHPAKMATLAASAALFLRGDVHPAAQEIVTTVPLETVIDTARASGPRVAADSFGVSPLTAFLHRTGIRLGPAADLPSAPPPDGSKFTSDTGQLARDTDDKVVTIDTPRSEAVIGFAERRSFVLGGIGIEFGALKQGFGIIQLTVLEGADFHSARRILVTAVATAENTGMQWKDVHRDSVGSHWGHAPSLVEGVPAKIRLLPGGKWKAWALDERGQRHEAMALQETTLEIGPDHKTLWYELSAE